MILFVEALFVGIYSSSIYLLLTNVIGITIHKRALFYFLLGYFKHFIGFIIGLHYLFCNIIRKIDNYKSQYIWTVFINSIIEGFIYIVLGSLFTPTIKVAFFIGFILHIISEYIGIHKDFCIGMRA
jgi:hypothetical protein